MFEGFAQSDRRVQEWVNLGYAVPRSGSICQPERQFDQSYNEDCA